MNIEVYFLGLFILGVEFFPGALCQLDRLNLSFPVAFHLLLLLQLANDIIDIFLLLILLELTFLKLFERIRAKGLLISCFPKLLFRHSEFLNLFLLLFQVDRLPFLPFFKENVFLLWLFLFAADVNPLEVVVLEDSEWWIFYSRKVILFREENLKQP